MWEIYSKYDFKISGLFFIIKNFPYNERAYNAVLNLGLSTGWTILKYFYITAGTLLLKIYTIHVHVHA